MIFTVTLHPALDQTLEIPGFAMGEVNRVQRERTEPGGKGVNVAKVLCALGEPCCAMALLGGARGREFARGMEAWPVETNFVETGEETRVNAKVFDPLTGLTTDINTVSAWNAAGAAALRERLLARLQAGDVAVLSGSLPAGAPEGLYAQWIAACKARGAQVILDASGPAFAQGLLANPMLSKPNVAELSQLVGAPLTTAAQILAAAQQWLVGEARMLVSDGARGAYWVTRTHALYAPALPVRVRGAVGAGDAMVAALAFGLAHTLAEEEAFCLAVAAGAACVEAGGSGEVQGRRLRELCAQVKPEPVG